MDYIDITLKQFEDIKKRAEEGMNQLNDEEFFWSPNEESNSIAIIVKHISGNMHSRWTNFMTEDGEKPYRKRDNEFIYEGESRDFLMKQWEAGWFLLFETLTNLQASDLKKIIYLREKPLSVMEAIQISLSHLSYHLGQILYAGKSLKGENWKILSIPKSKD